VRFAVATLLVALACVAAACEVAARPAPGGAPAAGPLFAGEATRDHWRQPAALVAGLAVPPGARVADVGAGDGYLTWRLVDAAGPTGRVVATDVNALTLMRLAIRTHAAAEARVVVPDAPGLEAGGYDLIVLAEVDHLLADRAAYFPKLAVALAPGGRLAVENRVSYRAAVLAAAAKAGLALVAEPADSPGRFLLVFARSSP
jgi:predicted methyltransferase